MRPSKGDMAEQPDGGNMDNIKAPRLARAGLITQWLPAEGRGREPGRGGRGGCPPCSRDCRDGIDAQLETATEVVIGPEMGWRQGRKGSKHRRPVLPGSWRLRGELEEGREQL